MEEEEEEEEDRYGKASKCKFNQTPSHNMKLLQDSNDDQQITKTKTNLILY